ncbi:PEP-CTERM sorting domain-containing protein [Ningiella sp. W23]|uniref:PEP-CTERM sorting domain-containing protein n=1 Tax=Ningiella sp. W23 TaxID=3023715 RepID=UPI003757767C
MDFEGLDNLETIGGFYNGGTSGNGNSGTNFGIEFNADTLAIIDSDAGGTGNFGGEPSPDTVMFFLTGSASIMNVAAGFETGFSFFYSAINNSGNVSVYDGLDGTGTELATLFIPTTPSDGGDPSGAFSPFFDIGVAFAGTARSVVFYGVADQIAFDNITFGSDTPILETPTPSTLAIVLLAATGLIIGRRKSGTKLK